MPRPKTKSELLHLAEANFNKLYSLIDGLDENILTKEFNFEDRDRTVRDVLAHLYEWHQLLINWANNNTKGIEKPFLLEPFNWKTYPKMNILFWEKHQNTSYTDIYNMLKNSHSEVISLIESFSNDELFTKEYFDWTGTTALGSYFISSTSSHYDWALKKVKNHLKTI